MTVKQVAEDLYRKLGIEATTAIPASVAKEVADAINGALQMIYAAPLVDWLAEEQALSSSELNADILRVVGPVWGQGGTAPNITQRTLIRVENQYELLRSTEALLEEAPADEYLPLFYCIETTKNESGEERLAFRISQSQGAGNYRGFVIPRPPQYADMTATTAIPMPHLYAESVLLPIARKQITNSHRFTGTPQAFDAAYENALVMIGLLDPLPRPAKGGRA